MSKHVFAKLQSEYQSLWDSMVIQRSSAIDAAARRIIKNKARYQAISKMLGGLIPWAFIGVIHLRESNLDFEAHLHNGDKPLNAKTRLVPRGRGPFGSFEESACDALKMKAYETVTDWSIARQAFELEKYNGFGYRNRKAGNPYLWGGTNHYIRGKYVRDGVYDKYHVDMQLGVMPILKRIEALDVSKKDLVETSSTLSMLRRARLAIQAVGGTVASSFTMDAFGVFKDSVEMVKGFVADNWVLLLALGIAIVWAVMKSAETKRLKEAEEGRYLTKEMVESDEAVQ